MSRHKCDKYPCSDESCEHYRSPLEQELTAKVKAVVKDIPDGNRANINGCAWVDVRILCSGSSAYTAYYCILKPGHDGKCYSANKQVYFTPDIKDQRGIMSNPPKLTVRQAENRRRACLRKKRYLHEGLARREAARRGIAAYQCKFCGDYHLTSHDGRDVRKLARKAAARGESVL